jgi:hypothetical protein
MAKEPIAGQPDEFDTEEFVDKLIDLLHEYNAEELLGMPDALIASYMWNQAINLSEVTEAFVETFNEKEE